MCTYDDFILIRSYLPLKTTNAVCCTYKPWFVGTSLSRGVSSVVLAALLFVVTSKLCVFDLPQVILREVKGHSQLRTEDTVGVYI